MDQPRLIFTDEHGERMSTKLAGELLSSITRNLAHSVSTRSGVVLEWEATVRRVAVVLTAVV